MAEPHLALDSTVCTPTQRAQLPTALDAQHNVQCTHKFGQQQLGTAGVLCDWALQGYSAVGCCSVYTVSRFPNTSISAARRITCFISSPFPAFISGPFKGSISASISAFVSASISGSVPLPFPLSLLLSFPLSFPDHFQFIAASISALHFRPASAGPFPLSFPGHFGFHVRLISASISGPVPLPVPLSFPRFTCGLISGPFPRFMSGPFPLSCRVHVRFHFRSSSALISGPFPLSFPAHFRFHFGCHFRPSSISFPAHFRFHFRPVSAFISASICGFISCPFPVHFQSISGSFALPFRLPCAVHFHMGDGPYYNTGPNLGDPKKEP